MRGSRRGGKNGVWGEAGPLIGDSMGNLDSSMEPQVYHQRDLQRNPTFLRGCCSKHVRGLLEVCEEI